MNTISWQIKVISRPTYLKKNYEYVKVDNFTDSDDDSVLKVDLNFLEITPIIDGVAWYPIDLNDALFPLKYKHDNYLYGCTCGVPECSGYYEPFVVTRKLFNIFWSIEANPGYGYQTLYKKLNLNIEQKQTWTFTIADYEASLSNLFEDITKAGEHTQLYLNLTEEIDIEKLEKPLSIMDQIERYQNFVKEKEGRIEETKYDYGLIFDTTLKIQLDSGVYFHLGMWGIVEGFSHIYGMDTDAFLEKFSESLHNHDFVNTHINKMPYLNDYLEMGWIDNEHNSYLSSLGSKWSNAYKLLVKN